MGIQAPYTPPPTPLRVCMISCLSCNIQALVMVMSPTLLSICSETPLQLLTPPTFDRHVVMVSAAQSFSFAGLP